jgi:AcrR family transcriptional regulator
MTDWVSYYRIRSMARTVPPDRFHELIQAATALFLESGYRRAQMGEIAERAGLAKGTVYLYFESKEALLDAVLEHADAPQRIAMPDQVPVPAPRPGAMLKRIRERVSAASSLRELSESLERRRVTDLRAELEAIVRELYSVLASHRVGIKLLDRCAPDYPELAAIWYRGGREGALELLRRYLEDRTRRRLIRPMPDLAVTARAVLELVVFWAVHRHWDPNPSAFDESLVEATVVALVTRALTGE